MAAKKKVAKAVKAASTSVVAPAQLDVPAVLKSAKTFFQGEKNAEASRAKRVDALYALGLRGSDCYAKTSRLDRVQFGALKLLALGAIHDDATRQMALMSKEEYAAKRDELEGDAKKRFQKFRADATGKAGPYLASLAAQLDTREPQEVREAKAAAKAKAAEAKKAEKEAADSKTGREKILEQLANIQSIMQNDKEPDYQVPALQSALAEVMDILG
jgi:hypothetical protein